MPTTPEQVEGKILKDSKGRLQGVKFIAAGMNTEVDPAELSIESGQCADICNCDVDNKAAASRRDGFILSTSGNITSAWANDNKVYAVSGNLLCTIADGVITPLVNSPTMLDRVEFKQVNNIVVYSDGVTIGLIENDVVFVFSDTIKFD